MKKALQILALLMFSTQIFAGELIKDAVITKIGTSSDGVSDDFFIYVSAGTGICAESRAIIFPRALAPSEAAFNRMYSTALTAFSTKKRIRAVSMSSNSCTLGSYIDIYD